MRKNGKIESWNDARGYGFIAPADGASRVFVHIKAFRNRKRRPIAGDEVTYGLMKDDKGRLRASNPVLAGNQGAIEGHRNSGATKYTVAFVFFIVVGGSVLVTGLPLSILIAYLAVSLVTFAAYARDKFAAQRGRWRTSEATLQLLSLAGGWPGAMVAQQMLRHKSRKRSFLAVFWLAVVLNCAAFAWIHTEDGRKDLQNVLILGGAVVREFAAVRTTRPLSAAHEQTSPRHSL